MRLRSIGLRLCLAILMAFAGLGCAVPARDGGGFPAVTPPPAANRDPARIGLPRIYRPFVDALEGSGDWVLIEPFGWVFRPDVNTVAWRPYRDGTWEPSDAYGWIWNGTDEFSWITDHYGSWFLDRFQGWVWQPGPVWGPAWVAWVAVGDHVGWAPLAPEGYTGWDDVPGGAFLFVRAQQFDLENGAMQARLASEIPVDDAEPTPVGSEVVVEGRRLIIGPSVERLRSMGGMPRTRDTAEPRRFELDTTAQAPALEARLRAAVSAGRREWAARGAKGAAPAPRWDGSRGRTSAPPPKARVTPLGAPKGAADSTRTPARAPAGAAEPDSSSR